MSKLIKKKNRQTLSTQSDCDDLIEDILSPYIYIDGFQVGGLVGGGVSIQLGFEVSKVHTIHSQLSVAWLWVATFIQASSEKEQAEQKQI